MVPIQIQSQALRRRQAALQASAVGDLALMSADTQPDASEDRARRKAQWRQADLRRAIGAAQQAGLASYRIEIAPDGTISIVVGDPSETAAISATDGALQGL